MRTEQACSAEAHGLRAAWDAAESAYGTVQFDLAGTILEANEKFLAWTGFAPEDLVGKRFESLWAGQEQPSWERIAAGQQPAGLVSLTGQDARFVWVHAVYRLLLDAEQRPWRVIVFCTNLSRERILRDRREADLTAIYRTHAVISFDLNGIILEANRLFLDAMGYELDELVGCHHRIFVEPAHVHSLEYSEFWRRLEAGLPQAGQYRRFAKNGAEVWLQAIYTPVLDHTGTPVKIIKFATPVTHDKLRQAQHQGQIAAIHKSLCVISFSLDGTILDANDNFLDATGYRLSELLGHHHDQLIDPAIETPQSTLDFWHALSRGEHHSGEFKRLGKNGRELWLQATYNPILDLNGRPFRIVKYATVITGQKLLHADLQSQIAAIQRSQATITFNLDGIILEANENFCHALGYTRADLEGQHHSMLVSNEFAGSVDYQQHWDTLREGRFVSGLYKRVAKDGSAVWIQASYNPILDLNGKVARIIKFATDVTSNVALAEAYEDAKRQSQHDPATALPNRVRLLSFMNRILSQPDRSLAILYIDLDRFKPINDAFGHPVGDYVLGQVADRLRRALTGDQLAARIGGDEFVVAAPDIDETDLLALCQGITEKLAEPVFHDGHLLRIGASIGVATSQDGRTPDELLRCADAAMYRAKTERRGSFSFYAATLNDRMLAYRTLVDEIRLALAERDFVLEYQPRFQTATRRIVGVEALVRWQHRTRGRISPGDFIPAAERSGLIVPLGRWVLLEACRQVLDWPGLAVSVNVSPAQFASRDLVAMVRDTLAETGLDPSRLELEITESVIISDADLARSTLDGLKALGVKISMDDFGTGYSSLSSLRTFPFDALKIDRQFTRDMDTRDSGREVVRAILALASAWGLRVTAEGVETQEQLAMLVEDRCNEVQGFLIAKPLPPKEIARLLRDGPDIDLEDPPAPRPGYVRRRSRASACKTVGA